MAVHEVFPYLRVHDGADALRYYTEVFGGKVVLKLIDPSDGRVGHAEVDLGDGRLLMLSDEYPEIECVGPRTTGRATQSIHLHVDDADAVVARMVEAGGVLKRPVSDAFYGERSGTVVDPFGHEWLIGHEIERVPAEEMQRRWDAMVAGSAGQATGV